MCLCQERLHGGQVIINSEFIHSGNFNSSYPTTINSVIDRGITNNIKVINCIYGENVVKGITDNYIIDENELIEAIKSGRNIKLSQDISLTKSLDLTEYDTDVYIDGHKDGSDNKYSIITENPTIYGSVIVIDQDYNYILRNLVIVNKKDNQNKDTSVGIRIQGGKKQHNNNIIIDIENCIIDMINNNFTYPINMSGAAQYANVSINKCILKGAIPLQCWGDYNKLIVEQSQLICSYVNNADYGSHCIALQANSNEAIADKNTLTVNKCSFSAPNYVSGSGMKEIVSIMNRGRYNNIVLSDPTYYANIIQGVTVDEQYYQYWN